MAQRQFGPAVTAAAVAATAAVLLLHARRRRAVMQQVELVQLHLRAILDGNAKLVSVLVLEAGAAVNQAMDGVDWTPLFAAIYQPNAEIVSVLLAAGAAVNQALDDGTTPLLHAIMQSHIEIVSMLLAAGAAVNQALDDGWTPLLHAIQKGQTEIVSVLLEAGATVNQATGEYETPMFTAIAMGYTDGAKLLSSYGASRSFQSSHPALNTASGIAALGGHDNLAAWFITSSQWSTPLHHLTIIGATRARALLRAGADLEAAAEAGGGPTPLSLARALLQADKAGEDTAASLVLDAAKPWSQQTHALFPAAARARAVELMLLGHRLSRESVQWGPSFVGAEVSLFDAWMVGVLPQAVQRGFCQL